MGCGALVSMLVMGPVITKQGSHRITQISCILTLLAFAALSLSHSMISLLVLVFIFGLCSGLMDLAMNTNAVSVEKKMGKPIMSSFHAAWSFGGMLGAAVGGVLTAWKWSLVQHFSCISLGATIVSLAFFASIIRDSASYEQQSENNVVQNGNELSLFALAIVCCFSFISEGAIGDWSALYLREEVRVSESIAPLGYAAFSFAMASGRLGGDFVIKKLSDLGALLAGGILTVIGVLLVVAYPEPYSVVSGLVMAGLGLSVQVPITFRLAGHSPSRPSAESIAVVARAGYFGLLAGPSFFGYLAEWFGLRWSLSVLVLLAVCTVFLALNLHLSPKRT